jgi:type 1 fimbria pilin
MLGEKIGEISGKVTMQRVLPNPGGDPKMETSFQASGSVLGTNIKDTGTYWTIFRPDGTQYSEGQGVMMTNDGKAATWTGHGVGVRNKDGTATHRGALYFQTMPQKWSRLNKVAVLLEYAVDAEGNTRSEYWEWK